jgi:hypothetical protein
VAAHPHPRAIVLVCTWAQDERPADLHMAQPNVPVGKTGHTTPARLVWGSSDAGRPHSCYDRQVGGEHLMLPEAICHVCLLLPGKPGLIYFTERYIQTVPTGMQQYAMHACKNAD